MALGRVRAVIVLVGVVAAGLAGEARPVAATAARDSARPVPAGSARMWPVPAVSARVWPVAPGWARPVPVARERARPVPMPMPVPVPVPVARFGWPLAPVPAVTRPFQPPSTPYGPGHRGADLAGTPDQPVLAPADGTVVYAAPLADRGVVAVDHADGLRTSYEPVTAVVRGGQRVRRGEPLGRLASGHRACPAPACLHWGLRRNGQYLDPLLLVRVLRVRLLPRSDRPG